MYEKINEKTDNIVKCVDLFIKENRGYLIMEKNKEEDIQKQIETYKTHEKTFSENVFI
jgi:hypothetical protein